MKISYSSKEHRFKFPTVNIYLDKKLMYQGIKISVIFYC